MVEHARDFGKHDTDVLRTNGHFQAHEFFNRQTICVFIAHHGHVIEAVHVRQRLNVGFALRQFFSGAVQQTNVRICALHHLAVKLEHQTQHAVCGRVLRAQIQGVVFDVCHGFSSIRRNGLHE